MKLCVKCKYCNVFDPAKELSQCNHAKAVMKNTTCPVTGKVRIERHFCSTMRYDFETFNKCGSDGLWFEEKTEEAKKTEKRSILRIFKR